MKDISTIKNDKILEIVLEVSKRLRNIFKNKLEKVVLFGSYARGDYNSESDIDIMALIDMSKEELSNYYGIVTDAIFDLELENDIIISTIEESYEIYHKYLNVLPFYKNIYDEGIIIYGRN